MHAGVEKKEDFDPHIFEAVQVAFQSRGVRVYIWQLDQYTPEVPLPALGEMRSKSIVSQNFRNPKFGGDAHKIPEAKGNLGLVVDWPRQPPQDPRRTENWPMRHRPR
ncbi:hypothetical protein AAL_08122 [Moelleriella libera RCEF 2490]|uniref:Uncharacterized protein n=1 Tax=Moelleriella libera RCEF 2490 TaxID=1081109 RepID=A0A167W3K2_9HYPO|nr:hypothetical protein AAL_08122 [Moelleriella libera RCEF 2490]